MPLCYAIHSTLLPRLCGVTSRQRPVKGRTSTSQQFHFKASSTATYPTAPITYAAVRFNLTSGLLVLSCTLYSLGGFVLFIPMMAQAI